MDLIGQLASVGAVLALLGLALWWLRRRGWSAAMLSRHTNRHLIESLERLPLGTAQLCAGIQSALTAGRLFSDLLVHNMGSGLADGISQGNAGGDEFRTAPLWGLGQRIYFLHDGRTSDLLQAIQAHRGPGSEGNFPVGIFNHLTEADKQDILNFLRSL